MSVSPLKKSRKSVVEELPPAVKENLAAHQKKVTQVLGDKKLMPRAARKRLGSSLSGDALHLLIEERKREDEVLDHAEHAENKN